MVKRISKHIKSYFTFTRSEVKGTIGLLVLVGLLILLKWLLPYFTNNNYSRLNDVVFVKADSIITAKAEVLGNKEEVISNKPAKEEKKDTIFDKEIKVKDTPDKFNPNTVTYEGLISFGFTPKVARTLIKYRNAGAQFKKPEDIKRVYGMTDEFYKKIEGYIIIE